MFKKHLEGQCSWSTVNEAKACDLCSEKSVEVRSQKALRVQKGGWMLLSFKNASVYLLSLWTLHS